METFATKSAEELAQLSDDALKTYRNAYWRWYKQSGPEFNAHPERFEDANNQYLAEKRRRTSSK